MTEFKDEIAAVSFLRLYSEQAEPSNDDLYLSFFSMMKRSKNHRHNTKYAKNKFPC